MKLFCIPFAGGSATVYQQWKPYLARNIDLIPVELAGRGTRFNESFYKSYALAIEDIMEFFHNTPVITEYALFGHSMGGILAYEVALGLAKTGYKSPDHAIISGCLPPNCFTKQQSTKDKKFKSWKDYLTELGGMTDEFFDDNDLKETFLPIIQADFSMLEDYKLGSRKLDCSLSIFYGTEDRIGDCSLYKGWGKFVKGKVTYYSFTGGHFFVKDSMPEVVNTINKILNR